MFDLVFRNGSVIDGTGSPAYTADVAVKDGEIAAIGRIEGESANTIDAAGLAITPGFIDLHTHSDHSFLLDSTAPEQGSPGRDAGAYRQLRHELLRPAYRRG